LSRFYRIHEFAELAGVTVKALHHYDRLDLLKPGRSGAGYRMYCESDLGRLEQIVALKFLGLPLKQIKGVLDRAGVALPEALRMQRRALEEKHSLLGNLIRAVRAAEEAMEPGKPADPAVLKKIIEVIEMQDDVEVMRKYYGTEESWERHRRYYEEGPAPEWRELYREVQAVLGEDPGSERVQALVARWFELSRKATMSGDPALQTDSPTAWMDRANWPPAMKRRIEEFRLEEITAFLGRAFAAEQKKYFSEVGWVKLHSPEAQVHSSRWQARVDLFREIAEALGEDPAGERGQKIAARFRAQREDFTKGDPDVKAGLDKMWADRRNWRRPLRWQTEVLCGQQDERFDRCADFLDQALAAAHTLSFTDASFEGEVLRSDVPVLVDFWKVGCGGCRQLAPIVDVLAGEYAGKVKVGKMDALANGGTAARYKLRALPTVLVFKGGEVVEQRVGVAGKAELQKMLDSHL
jgi:thioredoxin